MTEGIAIARARELFLEHDEARRCGCAETTLVVLQEAFELPQAADSSVAMAFNGGVAWSGGLCGALSGAAMAQIECVVRRALEVQDEGPC